MLRLLGSIEQQTYPRERITVHVIREGSSEEAKAIGINRCTGDLIGMFCADNVLVEPDTLERLATAASVPYVVGAYTTRYAHVRSDRPLSRYFALLGANDPLCWWLGKADRLSYLPSAWGSRRRSHLSLGDNGFVIRRTLAQQVVHDPKTFGSCMDMCEELRRLGHQLYRTVDEVSIWHRSGESLWVYLKKRWRYTNALYFDQLAQRRWRMVQGPRDWLGVVLFALASCLVLPHLWLSLRGYRSVQDPAWFLHPAVCGLLTCLYTLSLCRYILRSVWLFPASIGRRS